MLPSLDRELSCLQCGWIDYGVPTWLVEEGTPAEQMNKAAGKGWRMKRREPTSGGKRL